jgi:glycosyltransferase involved in cell wall biosynthesis
VRDARCCALNGGSLLLQAIAQHAPSVAAPIADDQPARIGRCAGLGLVRPVAFNAGELSAGTSNLALDRPGLEQLRTRLIEFDLRSGLDLAVEALDRLLPPEHSVPVPRSDSGRRLRLMHVILSSGFAGSERAVAEFCSAAAEWHEVAVVLRRDHRSPGGASIRDHLGPDVQVIELPSYVGTRRALEEAIADWRPDVVHTHLRRSTRYVAQIAPEKAVHFCTLHLSLNGPHFLYSDGLVCISQWQQATLPGDYDGKVFLIPNSLVPQPRLDPARRRELRRQLGAGDDDFLIGGVGRLTPSKGFDILVKAFRQAGLPGAKLTIVGEGRARHRLERLAEGQVTFTGHRHDAKDCFQAFDLFVSPSRYEPFGRVIVEALDGGVPVIATDVLGPRDIARRYPVELVPTEDPATMAAALRHVFERPRTRLAVDLSEFHIDRVVRRTLDAYLELRNARSPGLQARVQS